MQSTAYLTPLYRITLAALLGSLMGLGSGCATTGDRYSGLPQSTAGESMLVIYRGDSTAAQLRNIEFRIGSKALAVLPNNSHTIFTLVPGTYQVEAQQTAWLGIQEMKPITTQVDCQQAQRCFVRYAITNDGSHISHRIATVSAEVAEKELSSTRYAEPLPK